MASWLLALGATAFAAPTGVRHSVQSGVQPTSAETVRKELLASCRELRDGHNIYFGTAQVAHIRGVLAEPDLEPASRVRGHGLLGRELLRLGQNEAAVRAFEAGIALAEQGGVDRRLRLALQADLGMAWLRLGEVTNCVGFHNPQMCVFPIAEAGRHRDPEAANKALRTFRAYLEAGGPATPTVSWLMNVAAMTVGRFPEAVPKPLRVAQSSLTGESFTPFANVASQVGLDIHDNAGGAVVDDFDGDGLLDVLTSSVEPCTPLRFYRNDGRGGFENRAEQFGLDVQLGGSNLLHADYDNDGDLDLLVLRGGWQGRSGRLRNSLLRNDGGRFVDVTAGAGLAEPAYPTQSAGWADYDLDGDLDLYIGNEGIHPQQEVFPSQLMRNNGNGTFTDVAMAVGADNGRYTKGVAWGDFDDDGDPDLYLSNLGPNRLLRNDSGRFTDVAVELGVTEPASRSFPTWFFDYDNDGRLDLFVASYRATTDDVATHLLGRPVADRHPLLYRNTGSGFRELSRELGLTAPSQPMGANFGDLDNDGYLDFYLGTGLPSYESILPNQMFLNRGGKRFADITVAGGFGHLQKGHGVAFADLDNDGDQDVFEQMGGAFPGDPYPSVLYQNPGHGSGWITLVLEGRRSNRSAIGTRLFLKVETPAGPRQIHRRVGTGGSFGGSPLRQEIGLGSATKIRQLTAVWPASGLRQTFENIEPGAFYRLVEGEEKLIPIELPRLTLGAGRAHGGSQHDSSERPAADERQPGANPPLGEVGSENAG